MTVVAAAVVGSAVVGYAASNQASKRMAASQSKAADAGIAEQGRQFDKITELLSPYSLAATGKAATAGGEFDGAQYLLDNPDVAASAKYANDPLGHYNDWGRNEGRAAPLTKATAATSGSLSAQQDLLGLNGADAQKSAIDQIQQSPLFDSLARQGEDSLLQNSAATGGLRGGNTQGALAQFRPQLLNQLIEQQYSKLNGLTTLGQNAAAGQASAAQSTGTNITNLLGQQGAANAGQYLAQGKAIAGLGSAFATAAPIIASKF